MEEPTDPAVMATCTLFPGVLEAARCLRRGKLEMAHAALIKVFGALPPQQLDGAGCSCLWVREVRDLCHHMEDALDDDAYLRPPPMPAAKLLFRDSVTALLFGTKKEERIDTASGGVTKGFMGRLEWLLSTFEQARDAIIQLMRITVGPGVDPRLPPVYRGVDNRDLVGMDHARDELIRLLMTTPPHSADGDQPTTARRRTVVSVLGSAGLGKTTLAKAAYDRLEAQFDCHIFCAWGPIPSSSTSSRGSRVITTTRYPRVIARAGGRVLIDDPNSLQRGWLTSDEA
jgi:disease resistance protein RPM1